MKVEDCRENAPHSVHLAVVLVRLCNDEEDREQGERHGKSKDGRIGRNIYLSESFDVSNRFVDLLWQRVELWKVGFEGGAVVCTISQCSDCRQCHMRCLDDYHLFYSENWYLVVLVFNFDSLSHSVWSSSSCP